jgi:hypothetical protein
MLSFCGYDFDLTVESVLRRDDDDDPVLCSAVDFLGQHWLIVQIATDPNHLIWLCAPTSVQALDLVASGSAEPGDVARHSTTGWVELVTTDNGRVLPDRCVPCAQLPAGLLPILPQGTSTHARWRTTSSAVPGGGGSHDD